RTAGGRSRRPGGCGGWPRSARRRTPRRATSAEQGRRRRHLPPGQVLVEDPRPPVDGGRAVAEEGAAVPVGAVAAVRLEVVARIALGLGGHQPVTGHL